MDGLEEVFPFSRGVFSGSVLSLRHVSLKHPIFGDWRSSFLKPDKRISWVAWCVGSLVRVTNGSFPWYHGNPRMPWLRDYLGEVALGGVPWNSYDDDMYAPEYFRGCLGWQKNSLQSGRGFLIGERIQFNWYFSDGLKSQNQILF